MAIDANALNMEQFALLSNSPLVRAITWTLIESGSILARDIPFVNKQTLVANGVRWVGDLPTVDWVPLNTEGTAITGKPTAYQEQAYQIRNVIDVDKRYVQDVNAIMDPRQALLMAFMKSWAYDFNDKFINNSHPLGDVDAPVGIRARLDTAGTTSVYGIPASQKIDAGGATADFTQAGMTAATFAIFTELIEQLLWTVGAPDGNGVVLYMNELLIRRWATGLRKWSGQGGFSTAQDQFGRHITHYNGARIVDAGYKADQATRIITATEGATGLNGSSTFTSIYAVNYGMDTFFGWQFEPLQAKDLGLLENGVIYRTFIDWMGGLYQQSHRALARLYDIKIS